VGMGGRARRVTGDQYDYFAVQYTYDDGMPLDSMCRQVDGCTNDVAEYLEGTEGSTNCRNTIFDRTGKAVWKYQEPGVDPGKSKFDPYVQEHVDLVAAIRRNQPLNEAENIAKSTLVAIMGRISAYTGQEVSWDQGMESNVRLGPTEDTLGPVPIKAEIPLPGTVGQGKEREI
jgi:hypothetical protein